MATVTLHSIWLNDGDDPSDNLELTNAGGLDLSPTVDGNVIVTASGRRISRTSGGKGTQWSVDSPAVPELDARWIDAHAGRNLWVRDWLGMRIYGVYFQPKITRRVDGSRRSDVSLTIDEVTPETV